MKTISSSVFRLSGCHQDSWSFIKPFQVLFSIITILCGNNNTNTTRCRYICNNPKAPSPRMDMRVIQRRRKKGGKWGNDQFDHVTILKFWLKNSTIPIKCKSWTASTYSLKKYGSITAETGAGQPRPSLWWTLGCFLDTFRHQQPTFRPLGGGLCWHFAASRECLVANKYKWGWQKGLYKLGGYFQLWWDLMVAASIYGLRFNSRGNITFQLRLQQMDYRLQTYTQWTPLLSKLLFPWRLYIQSPSGFKCSHLMMQWRRY